MCRKVAQVIGDVVDFAKMAHCASTCVDMLTSLDETLLFLKHQALGYRLLSVRGSLQPSENIVCITTLIFLLNVTEYQGAHVSARTTPQYLTSDLANAAFGRSGSGVGFCFGVFVLVPWPRSLLERVIGSKAC